MEITFTSPRLINKKVSTLTGFTRLLKLETIIIKVNTDLSGIDEYQIRLKISLKKINYTLIYLVKSLQIFRFRRDQRRIVVSGLSLFQ